MARFEGPVGLIISGRDLTAREFEDAAGVDPLWRRLLAEERVSRHDLPQADHTFSRRLWRQELADWTLSWLERTSHRAAATPPAKAMPLTNQKKITES